MKKLLSAALVLCMCIGMIPLSLAGGLHFTDVPSDAWYYDDLQTAYTEGLINGKTATEFKPDDNMTYAEAIKLAACMHQRDKEGSVSLENGTPWYKPYVDYCMDNGVISKFSNYDYNAPATRAEYMNIFANALPEEKLPAINDVPMDSIPDYNGGNSYAKQVYLLYRAGIVGGVDAEHNCKPNTNIKRSEVATILARMMFPEKRIRFSMGNKETKPEDVVIPPETPEIEDEIPTEDVGGVDVLPSKPVDGGEQIVQDTPLSIYKQPVSYVAEEYGEKYQLEVQVFGGKAPYTYQWYYYGYRNNKEKLTNGDFIKDVTSDGLVISVEKDNTLLGEKIFCQITDANGAVVSSESATVVGPFSMTLDEVLSGDEMGEYKTVGRVADGILHKGDKVSIVRNGKIIAFGYVTDIEMFNKSIDEAKKNENIGATFDLEDGARPGDGDTMIKYKEGHTLDLSDIIN